MLGADLLMKSLGVDPEDIKKQVSQAGDDFKKVVKQFDERLNKIDNVMYIINQNQLKIMARLGIDNMIAPNNDQSLQTIPQGQPHE